MKVFVKDDVVCYDEVYDNNEYLHMKGANNMLAFARGMLRDKFKSFIAYSLGSVAFLEMYVALFPTVQKQAGQFNQMMQTMPAELFKAMNMDPSSLSFGVLESYLSSEYMSFLWPILLIIFVISLANYISVQEVDKGTIETLMSLPASRVKIFVERYFAGMLLIAGFTAVSLFGAIPLAMLHGVDFVFSNYVTAFIGSFFFAWAIYSLAVLASVICSAKNKASTITAGIIMLMYVLNVIANLKDSIQGLRYGSFFYYFNGSDLLAKNVYPENALLALGGFAVVVTIVAVYIFKKRDLSV